jgi:hypothetical protein
MPNMHASATAGASRRKRSCEQQQTTYKRISMKASFCKACHRLLLTQLMFAGSNVCWELGIPYLWVDSLCITQPRPNTEVYKDKEALEDWIHEVWMMDNAYGNSYLTIYAEAGQLQRRIPGRSNLWHELMVEGCSCPGPKRQPVCCHGVESIRRAGNSRTKLNGSRGARLVSAGEDHPDRRLRFLWHGNELGVHLTHWTAASKSKQSATF